MLSNCSTFVFLLSNLIHKANFVKPETPQSLNRKSGKQFQISEDVRAGAGTGGEDRGPHQVRPGDSGQPIIIIFLHGKSEYYKCACEMKKAIHCFFKAIVCINKTL